MASAFLELLRMQLKSRADLLAVFTQHGTLMGTGREFAIAELLRELVPRKYEVLTGTVVLPLGATLGRSQVDLMLVNTMEFPTPLRFGDLAAVVPQAVDVVIEVKSDITGGVAPSSKGGSRKKTDSASNRREKSALEQIRDLHRLWGAEPKPPLSILYAYAGPTKVATLRGHLAKFMEGLSQTASTADQWLPFDFPDIIFVDTGRAEEGYVAALRNGEEYEFSVASHADVLAYLLARILAALGPGQEQDVGSRVAKGWAQMQELIAPELTPALGIDALRLELPAGPPLVGPPPGPSEAAP